MPAKRDMNSAYANRASKRKRTVGIDTLTGLGHAQISALMEDRRRAGRKQYRYADLQGTDRIEMLRIVRDCALAAMTNYEIAERFGVKESTLYDWVARDAEFAIAMRLPRDLADERVEKAIYHRAVGYSYRTEEVKIHDDGRVTRAPIVKHVPPDVGAAQFWLKNRKGHLWKDKQDVSVEGSIDVNAKADDPRALAMAVLDVIQQGIYAKLPATIDGEPVAVKPISEYTDEELQNMTADELDALYDAAGREGE